MKKLLILLLLMAGLSYAVRAQVFQAGLKGGLGFGAAQLEDDRWENDGLQAGLHAGLFTRLTIGSVFIQPEGYYTFTRAQLSREDVQVGGEELKLNFHRLDVPVLFGARLGKVFRVNAGPFVSVGINTKADNDNQNVEEELEDYYDRANWGWQAGLGLDAWKISLDLRYETTVGNMRNHDFENSSISDYLPSDQKQRQVLLSLGYRFGQGKD